MPFEASQSIDIDNAQLTTVSLLNEMESVAQGIQEKSMIIGNSMIAAAKLLFARSQIDAKQQADLYREFWLPIVAEGVDE